MNVFYPYGPTMHRCLFRNNIFFISVRTVEKNIFSREFVYFLELLKISENWGLSKTNRAMRPPKAAMMNQASSNCCWGTISIRTSNHFDFGVYILSWYCEQQKIITNESLPKLENIFPFDDCENVLNICEFPVKNVAVFLSHVGWVSHPCTARRSRERWAPFRFC